MNYQQLLGKKATDDCNLRGQTFVNFFKILERTFSKLHPSKNIFRLGHLKKLYYSWYFISPERAAFFGPDDGKENLYRNFLQISKNVR